jgi:NTE family protein
MIAVAFGAGGERLVPWYTGVAAGLADAGFDLRDCGLFAGTSAGALVAARLAAGVDPRPPATALAARGARPGAAANGGATAHGPGPGVAAKLFDGLAQLAAGMPDPGERGRAVGRLAIRCSPGGEAEHVARVRARLPVAEWPATLRIAAVDAETGERVAFGSASGVPLERALAAARSVPVLLPPVAVAGRRCIDAAVHSATNADLLQRPGVDRALVVCGSPADATGIDALWNRELERELALLADAGIETTVIRPTAADRAAMGPDPMSRARAPLAVRAGRRRAMMHAA